MNADCRGSKVVVKGKKADPMKVCERLQKKSGKKVELISPLPKPSEEKKKEEEEEAKKKEPEEKKEEVISTFLFFNFFRFPSSGKDSNTLSATFCEKRVMTLDREREVET